PFRRRMPYVFGHDSASAVECYKLKVTGLRSLLLMRTTEPATCNLCNLATRKIGQRGRTCTCGPSVPSRACCSYTTRCLPRRFGRRRGLGAVGGGPVQP